MTTNGGFEKGGVTHCDECDKNYLHGTSEWLAHITMHESKAAAATTNTLSNDIPVPVECYPGREPLFGWTCALCGKTNSPNVIQCPCPGLKK